MAATEAAHDSDAVATESIGVLHMARCLHVWQAAAVSACASKDTRADTSSGHADPV